MQDNAVREVSFFVIDYSMGGGVERVTSDLSTLFIRRGIAVSHIVSLHQSQAIPAMPYDASIQISVLNPTSKSDIETRIHHFLAEKKPQYLIFQADNMSIALSILRAAKKSETKAIAHYHGSPYAYLKKYPSAQSNYWYKILFAKLKFPFKKLKLQTFVQASQHGLVCVSQGAYDELSQLLGQQMMHNTTVIRNPYLPTITESTQKLKRVSFVSRLETKHKNAFLAIKMWEIVSKTIPDWELHIYGKGSLMQPMKKYIDEKNIDRIIFHGFVTDIHHELQMSSISISTSDCEGYSLGILDSSAMAHAVAITHSNGGIHDMIIDGKTGLISPRNDAKALAKNVIKLIENEPLRKEIGLNFRSHIVSLYASDVIDQWLDLLQQK